MELESETETWHF